MVNTFVTPSTSSSSKSATRSELQGAGISGRVRFNLGIPIDKAKTELNSSFYELQKAEQWLKLKPESEEAGKAFRSAARKFNNDVSRLGYAHGKIGASFNNMFKSLAETLGKDTSTWSSTKINGTALEAWERAANIKGSVVERIISKPIRVAGNWPALTLAGLATLGVIGVANKLESRDERQTQESAMRQAAELDAQMRMAQTMAQANTIHVPQQAESQFPAQGTQFNQASPQIMAGNIQHMGMTSQPQQQLAAL